MTKQDERKKCPVCAGDLDIDAMGHPMQSVCRKCEERLLEEHKDDELDNCPFCGADRTHLKHHLALPYFYGAEGVFVHCKKCGARGGWGHIRKRVDPSLSVSPIFNESTVHNGFKEANEKWNRREKNDSRVKT